jgi:hypothetical protein
LPRHENVTFWSSFYSRDAANGCTSCCHSWDKDGAKFLYRFVNFIYYLIIVGPPHDRLVLRCYSLGTLTEGEGSVHLTL